MGPLRGRMITVQHLIDILKGISGERYMITIPLYPAYNAIRGYLVNYALNVASPWKSWQEGRATFPLFMVIPEIHTCFNVSWTQTMYKAKGTCDMPGCANNGGKV